MSIAIITEFAFHLPQATDALLQFEAAELPEQRVSVRSLDLGDCSHYARIPAQDAIGERLWIRAEGDFAVRYEAEVAPSRVVHELSALARLEPHDMPGEAVAYLFDSRYCQSDRLQSFAEAEFGGTSGGARVAAIRDWIAANIAYSPGASDARTAAHDTMLERAGVCRDFAHVLIALARASAIPARYVACYAPGVEPPDFHAVAEVFLTDPASPDGGIWQMVDATGMADPAQAVKIGVGRDAADVSFLTSFGSAELRTKSISVRQVSATAAM